MPRQKWVALGALLLGLLAGGCTNRIAGSAQPTPDDSSEVCSWLSAADVQRAFGLSGLSSRVNGPIFDHDTPAYLCVYTDTDGASDAALETAEFPAGELSAQQLVRNFAGAGQPQTGSPGVGDASAFVKNLSGTANTGVVAVRRTGDRLRLVAVIVATSVGSSQNTLVSLLRQVFGKLP